MGRLVRLRIHGRAYLLLAFWLLTVPLRWVTGAVFAGLVHELGHLTALWAMGIPVAGLEIDIAGAVIHTGAMEPEEELLCALAGPLAGGLICLYWRWIPEAAVCAAVQTMFNLIPLYPLDGGRALASWRNICCNARKKGVQ